MKAKPKPAFDWAGLEKATAKSAPPGGQLREDVPGGFTAKEFAAKYDITQYAAIQRIRRLLRRGIVKKVALISSTHITPEGRYTCTPVRVYDVVVKE